MSKTVELFWSFRSPYCYLSTPQILALPKNYNVEIIVRPVLPAALRNPDFFKPENAKRVNYILMDWQRRAEMLDLPHAWPSPDPIVQDLETLKIAQEQPYIYRLTYLGIEAQRRGRGLEFIAEVSRLIFGGTRDWHQGDHLANATKRAGLNLADMDRAITDPQAHREQVEANQRALEAVGHWGVPTFSFENEPFFGQDRIDSLCWRLGRAGLRRSDSSSH